SPQLDHDLLLDHLEELPQVGAHEGDALAVAGRGDHERPRPQAQVDTGRLLVDPPVSHHPQLCGRPGDIVDAAANLKACIPRTRTGKARCPCDTTRAIRHDIGRACTTTCTDPEARGYQEDTGQKAEGFLQTGTHAKT